MNLCSRILGLRFLSHTLAGSGAVGVFIGNFCGDETDGYIKNFSWRVYIYITKRRLEVLRGGSIVGT